MLYSLFLVIFLSGGDTVDIKLKSNLMDDTCIDLRDFVRAEVDYTNDLDKPVYEGKQIDFVEVECKAQKLIV